MNYRRLALVPLAFVIVACSDKAVHVLDAAVDAAYDAAVDAATNDDGGDASAQPPVEMAITCDKTATQVITGSSGGVTTRTFKYADVTVDDPAAWTVVRCGPVTIDPRNECPSGSGCEGAAPPRPDCSVTGPEFTGNAIHVECEQSYVIFGGNTTIYESGWTSTKLVRR